jgi:hypothetical protein
MRGAERAAPPAAARFSVMRPGIRVQQRLEEVSMGLLLAVLAVIVILFILGFALLKFLLIIAAIVLVLWLLGFFVRAAEGARWYRW